VSAALSVTVDVDGEAGLAGGGSLSARSERLYGVGRGLDRVLAVLADFDVRATFYVPGVTAERHPDAIRAIAEPGHEIAHHGHTHASPHRLSAPEQRREIEHGLAALRALAIQPRGYRAPAWELTEVTLALLIEHRFAYDSSLMDDDRPYHLRGLLELPVHWTLDDAPHFAHTTDARGLLATWQAELEAARREGRHTTVTCHPEILGRAHRVDVLRCLLDEASLPCVTHGDVARSLA
jgi:peptidoglycan/xylan/chitin deacetylase (PgdA/CDA1 family)